MLKILGRTLLLMLAGLAALLLMAAWVRWTQHPYGNDVLRASAAADVVLPWEQAELWIDYTGAEGQIAPQRSGPSGPSTLLFLFDISGSMSDKLAAARQAILELRENLTSRSRSPRVGVMGFNNDARILIPFTDASDQLTRQLQQMNPDAGGGTSFIAGLEGALQKLDADGITDAVVVLVTDGQAESRGDLRRFYDRRWAGSGNRLFLVGIGTAASIPDSFFGLIPAVDPNDPATHDPTQYILPATDSNAIGRAFDQVASQIGNALGHKVRLQLPLAEPLWDWAALKEPAKFGEARRYLRLNPDPDAPNEFLVANLYARPYQWRVPLEARFGGILRVLQAPPRISYVTVDGRPYRLDPVDTGFLEKWVRFPKILVISWWLLLFMFLPALVYFIRARRIWLQRDTSGQRPAIPSRRRYDRYDQHPPPPNLPLRVAPANQRVNWAPGLVIGLGRPGRAVLTHLRQNIADTFDKDQTRPLLLALDVARDELEQGRGECFSGCLERLDQDQVFMLPEESCALHESIHAPRSNPDDPAASLDLTAFRHESVDALRLSNGTQGRGQLARLALLNDLAAGNDSALLQRLQSALASWRQISPEDANRQLILIADVDYGIGAGWLTDLLVLLRRMVAQDERRGQAVEFSLMLLGKGQTRPGDPDALIPLSAPTLFSELDRLSSAGSRPFEHRLANPPEGAAAEWPADLLAGRVDRRPHDAAFVLPTLPERGKQRESWAAAADAVTLLLDRERRIELTDRLQALQGVEAEQRADSGRELYTQLSIHSAVFPRSFFRAWLLNLLSRQLAGSQVLFPELKTEDGKLRLSALEPDFDGFLDENPDLPKSAGPLGQLLLGQSVPEPVPETMPDHLQDAGNELRRKWLDTLNGALRGRTTGLLGLAGLAARIAEQAETRTKHVESSLLEEWRRFAHSLNQQCLTWLKLFLGIELPGRHDQKPALTEQSDFLSEQSAELARVIEELEAWGEPDARRMIAPVACEELAQPVHANPKLEKLYTTFLRNWLNVGQDSLAEALADRCYWELTMPGDDGEPIGVNLVLRATEPYRYAPNRAELNRFLKDIARETAAVLDAANDFHALALLAETLGDDDRDEALQVFVKGLKGDLRGERDALLAALPNLDHIHDPALRDFHGRLVEIFDQTMASAADRVESILVKDRGRISVLQVLPLLRAEASIEPQTVLHRPERLLSREIKKYEEARHRTGVTLPLALGNALEHRPRLRDFARLYLNGQIARNPLDNLWYASDDKQKPARLTAFAAQTIADAAVWFAQEDAPDVDLASQPVAEKPYGFESDFKDGSGQDLLEYFKWLAEKST